MAGCKKNEVISASKMSDKEIIATYGKLGEFHNKALDYIYKELKKEADARNIGGKTSNGFTYSLLGLNQLAEAYLKDSLGYSNWDITPFYCTDTSYRNPEHLYETATFISHYTDIYNEPISSDLSSAINDLETLFRNDIIPP